MAHKPYLVQRILRRKTPDKSRKGVDQDFGFDYMGSAEFEFGALPKALKNMRGEKLSNKPQRIKTPKGDTAWYVGPETMSNVAREFFLRQFTDPYGARLKEHTWIKQVYEGEEFCDGIIGWWDIKSTYAIFRYKDDACKWLEHVK